MPRSMAVDDIKTGFVRADGDVQIYWRSVGTGPPLVCCNGVGVSFFFWKYLVEHFRDRYTLILWDYRGHGRSGRQIDPETADLSVQRHAQDLHALLAVLYPAGEPVILVGHSMGCQVCLEFHHLYPARTQALVLLLGTAGRALDTFFDWSGSPRVFAALHRLIFALGALTNELVRPVLESPLAWSAARRLKMVDPIYTRREDMLPYMTHLASLDFRIFIESVIQLNQHDAWGILPQLDRPLLVIAAENDAFTPMWCSRKIVEQTPGAELLVLADASHAALIEQPETINHRIARFLQERLPSLQRSA